MEKNKKSYLILVVCTVALIFSVAACNKKQGTESSGKSGPVRITAWEMYGPDRNINKITDAWNKRQNEVFAVDEFIPDHTGLMQKVQVSAAAGTGLPDAILVDMFYAPVINDLVGLVDLNPYMASDPNIKADDFYDNLRNFSFINGKQISLHAYGNNLILYYNKALFRAAGLDPDKPPKTGDELVRYGQALTKDGQWGFLASLFFDSYYETLSWQYQVFVWQNGGEMWDNRWQPTFNNPTGVEALQFLVDLVYKYKIGTVTPPENGFQQGRVAMILDGTWMGNNFEEALGENLAAAQLPGNKAFATNTGGEHWMILPSTKEREDATWKFLAHMLSEEVVTEICSFGGQVPTRKSIASSPEFINFANQHVAIKTSMEAMSNARMRAASSRYGAASEAMAGYIQEAMYNRMTAQDAVAAMSNAFGNAINGR
jgi:ABC-type glycerol-3-phosphate transport system substrate-binding protein